MKDAKQMISVRIEESDRAFVQMLAARLYVRESDIYRFAINHLLGKMTLLLDETCTGIDLLLALLEIRTELNSTLGLKRNQLERIINNHYCSRNKYVAMLDIELLLMSEHMLKQTLSRLYPAPKDRGNIDNWLKEYLCSKYNVIEIDENLSAM